MTATGEPTDRRQHAIHEAGHATIALILNMDVDHTEIYDTPQGASGKKWGETHCPDEHPIHLKGAFLLGGIEAQDIVFGENADKTAWAADLADVDALGLLNVDEIRRVVRLGLHQQHTMVLAIADVLEDSGRVSRCALRRLWREHVGDT